MLNKEIITIFIIFPFLVSLITNYLLILYSERKKIFIDEVTQEPQKFHKKPTPRFGGLGIYLAIIFTLISSFFFDIEIEYLFLLLVISSFFAFLSGIYEDITRSFSPKHRLFLMCIGAILAYLLLEVEIIRIDISYLDTLIAFPVFSFILTILFIIGMTNAINIIDGFNGLASGISIMIFLAIAYVSFHTGDNFILLTSFSMIGAILGFFIFNYPYGLIFLGDGGAYFIGFVIAVLSILLVKNHSEVSAWFPIMVSVYPIYETIFSIYRKKFLRKMSPMVPDGLHFHMVLYKTVAKRFLGINNPLYRNPLTSLLIWILNIFGVVPAVLFWDNTLVLIFFILLFMLIYTKIYFSLIKSKLPKGAY